jgi:NAD(P)-dependent dehydrogenase (short-subunit alcohol dehydrogenase family)
MADLDLSQLFRLDGRVAIVTGASSGLGDRFARVLHAAGAEVVVAARRADRLESLAADLGDRVTPVTCDVADEQATRDLVERTIDQHGRIDVLVNNAGVGDGVAAVDETLDHFRWTVDVNVVGLFALTQQVARHMIEAGSGSIVNIASIFGLVGSAPIKEASYCATKGAVVNLTRALACEWARRGVRVNAIAPGWFPTEMTQEEMFDDEAGLRFIETNTPMGRAGGLDELDGALLYLAGDASTYVTGQVLAVDGGWVAR